MFVFWGTTKTKKKLGYVADFCPVCRIVTPLQVTRIGVGEHLYGVSLGKGKLVGHEGVCLICQTRLGIDATTYDFIATTAGEGIDSLLYRTFPKLKEVRAARLALERQVVEGTLAPADRQMLLMEPFHLFSDLAESHFTGNVQVGGRGGWGCLGTFVTAFLVFMIGNAFVMYPEARSTLSAVVGYILLTGGLVSVVLMIFEPGRIFRCKMLPSLAKALRPLKPTQDEIADALARFKRSGYKLGKKLKPEVLWNEIQGGQVEQHNPASTSIVP